MLEKIVMGPVSQTSPDWISPSLATPFQVIQRHRQKECMRERVHWRRTHTSTHMYANIHTHTHKDSQRNATSHRETLVSNSTIFLNIKVTFTSFINSVCDSVCFPHTQAVVQTGLWGGEKRLKDGLETQRIKVLKSVANEDCVSFGWLVSYRNPH